jgi:hypothetical protein
MPKGLSTWAAALLLAVTLPTGSIRGQSEADLFFEARIRPVLAGTCFKCHGDRKTSGGLRVDSRQALLEGGDRGPALVPGDPDRSLLIQALRHTEGTKLRMPPGKKLPASTVADFTLWVKQGAAWPATRPRTDLPAAARHWAFQPVRKPPPPADPTGWSANAIDRFIRARQKEHGLQPVAPADRRTLLRRVYFDLIGLPPTPEEITAFLQDPSPTAYEKVVDRLLASPHYGERWGRHWMDLVRYADTAGDNADYPVPEAALYRDYIIASFNADKPYDQFLREQLAGDLLARKGPPQKYAERVIATTFLALSRRYLTAPYEQFHLTLEDTIDATGRAFLGLTLRCARCHDHKFDPVTREDYYALYGIFASTQYPYGGSEEFASMRKPRQFLVPLLPPEQAAPLLAAHQRKLAALRAGIVRLEKEDPLAKRVTASNRILAIQADLLRELRQAGQPADDVQQELARQTRQRDETNARLQAKLQPLRTELSLLERTNLPPDLPGAYAVADGRPVDVPIQIAGDPERPGRVVKRGVPRFLAGPRPPVFPADASGRLELANWLTAPDNPLTARVLVNRLWQYHFGKGLVRTPSNFGLSGQPPTHPELLDWLTARFVEGGWSLKAMHRLIVLSRTYRLSSRDEAGNAARDPANDWYWRFDRQRLDAEAIRDALLAVSGTLDRRRPGPHPFPALNAWHWTQHNPFKAVYPTRGRSVYLMTQRLQRHPFLALFDGPDTNVTTDTRTRSTAPLQALYLMNNPFVGEQARAFAGRLLRSAPDLARRVARGYELAWGRPPSTEEIDASRRYLERYTEELARLGVPAAGQEQEAWTSLARVLLSANEFVFVD